LSQVCEIRHVGVSHLVDSPSKAHHEYRGLELIVIVERDHVGKLSA